MCVRFALRAQGDGLRCGRARSGRVQRNARRTGHARERALGQGQVRSPDIRAQRAALRRTHGRVEERVHDGQSVVRGPGLRGHRLGRREKRVSALGHQSCEGEHGLTELCEARSRWMCRWTTAWGRTCRTPRTGSPPRTSSPRRILTRPCSASPHPSRPAAPRTDQTPRSRTSTPNGQANVTFHGTQPRLPARASAT